MLLRAQVLALGCSGVRASVLDTLMAMINRHVVPRIPSQGSVGASGDLAPLAHLALVLIGEGEAWHGELRESGAAALQRAGLAPATLAPKEGLALINGTQASAAVLALALADAERLARSADIEDRPVGEQVVDHVVDQEGILEPGVALGHDLEAGPAPDLAGVARLPAPAG